jgi:aspartate racemase
MQGTGPLIGILGGMGPLATAQFMAQVALLADARSDQQHCRSLVYSNPLLPDRSDAILNRGPSPLGGLLDGLALLDGCGADVIVMPCNTAHYWLSDLVSATPTPILSIVDAVTAALRDSGLRSGRVGLLGTEGLLRSGLYQGSLSAVGFAVVEPTRAELAELVEPAIRAIKAGDIDGASRPIARAIAALEERDVAAIVLGCTELPLAVTGRSSARGTPLVDSTRALALACLAWSSSFAPPAHRPLAAAS